MSTEQHGLPIGKMTLIVNAPAQAEASDGSLRTLQTGDNVYETDIISTTVRGFARLTLRDGTVIQLGPDSRLSLDNYVYSTTEASRLEATLSGGQVRVDSGEDGSGEQQTVLKTPSAVIDSRGGQLDVQVTADGSTRILQSSGVVEVRPLSGAESKLLYEGNDYLYVPIDDDDGTSGSLDIAAEIKTFREAFTSIEVATSGSEEAVEPSDGNADNGTDTTQDNNSEPPLDSNDADNLNQDNSPDNNNSNEPQEPSSSSNNDPLDGTADEAGLDNEPNQDQANDDNEPTESNDQDEPDRPRPATNDNDEPPGDDTENFVPDVIARNDDFTMQTGQVLRININDLLRNDEPAEVALSFESAFDAVNGSVQQLSTEILEFTPSPGFVGSASFDYRIVASNGDTDEATVVIVVQAPVNQPPNDDNGGMMPPPPPPADAPDDMGDNSPPDMPDDDMNDMSPMDDGVGGDPNDDNNDMPPADDGMNDEPPPDDNDDMKPVGDGADDEPPPDDNDGMEPADDGMNDEPPPDDMVSLDDGADSTGDAPSISSITTDNAPSRTLYVGDLLDTSSLLTDSPTAIPDITLLPLPNGVSYQTLLIQPDTTSPEL